MNLQTLTGMDPGGRGMSQAGSGPIRNRRQAVLNLQVEDWQQRIGRVYPGGLQIGVRR